ncbi:uncharacterized protein UMAG_12144 [Mycosarcoma maydis]|nr:uncharacterized protein UMAG_12144 [Ustilago maydis 521]KIS70415.1 hypothetical protein UMAG_12144 [Ustilago maydis 521]|eukprot:XP_011388124.1 hypothetical protein UMAG_12144 [Ustilago maydis 521]
MAEGDASADTDTKVSNKVSELGDDNPSYLESPWFGFYDDYYTRDSSIVRITQLFNIRGESLAGAG